MDAPPTRWEFTPLRSPDEVRAEADQLLADAKAEADRLLDEARVAKADAQHITEEAKGLRARTLAGADTEAKRIRDEARAEVEKRQERDDLLDTWSARAVILGAVGLTASGEYELARMVGFDARVAWLLPLVIDVYVVQAFRRHRDMAQAIGLTIAANVIFHLADKGLFGVEQVARNGHEPKWWLIAMVASIASLILWRMHLITSPPKTPKGRRSWRRKEPAAAPTPQPVDRPVEPPAAASNGGQDERQEPPVGGQKPRPTVRATAAKTPAKSPAKTPANPTGKTPAKSTAKKRRSMDEWVEIGTPVFHAEFTRLRRNPSGTEFAKALQKAGYGKPSASTAKNIKTEILDRAELPSLDGVE